MLEHVDSQTRRDRAATTRQLRTYTCPMHPEIRQPRPGFCPKCGMALEPVDAETPTARTEYVCPMHPQIVRDARRREARAQRHRGELRLVAHLGERDHEEGTEERDRDVIVRQPRASIAFSGASHDSLAGAGRGELCDGTLHAIARTVALL